MDKAVESVGNEIKEIPFDFTRHIVIPNRVAKMLSNEVWTETTLINNYFNIEERLGGLGENSKDIEMKDGINKLLGKLYSEFGKENVWITICDNTDYNAIIAKIDSNDTEGESIRGEFHIYFTTFGGLERTVYLFKTHIEILLGGWNSIDYKNFCKEIQDFAKESGIKKFKGYRCNYPIFYTVSDTVNIRESDYNVMFDTIRTLKDRYELGEWDAEKIRLIVTKYH
jgi:hypothetical protein